MLEFDLAKYREKFCEALRTRYNGNTFDEGFKAIEKLYKPVRSGDRGLVPDDVFAIFDPSLPYAESWTKPDRTDLEERMRSKEVARLVRELRDREYDAPLVREIWICFRELSLTALVLQHVYPARFAMCSHHLASLLHVGAPTVPDFYIEYCKELKKWSGREWPTRRKLSVLDTEFALWTWYRLTYFGRREERRRHREAFFNDRWVQERRAERIACALGPIGKLDLARSYLKTQPTVAAMIAWREFETKVRNMLGSLGEKASIWELIERLPESSFPPSLAKDKLNLWRKRNPVIHAGHELKTSEDASVILDGVIAFIDHNDHEDRNEGF